MGIDGIKSALAIVIVPWGLQYFLWGVIGWVLWRLFRRFIQSASMLQMFVIVLPVSLATYFIETMFGSSSSHITQSIIRSCELLASRYIQLPGRHDGKPGHFLVRLLLLPRHRDITSSSARRRPPQRQLEVQLSNAKMAALRMQLNPHFLFNTMNSISSLMRSDVDAADAMLEHLSSLLRMTLERGHVQLISLHDEIEFTETYLAMQDQRYAGRVTRMVSVDPELHDALVPAMILQPIVENAYAHGLSKLDRGGQLYIDIRRNGQQLKALITNNGVGLRPGVNKKANGSGASGNGVGLTNVIDRLRLHYGDDGAFTIHELDLNRVQVSISFPLQFSAIPAESLTRYGA